MVDDLAVWLPPLLMLVGVIGIVVPILPGLLITLGGAFVWALQTGTTLGWVLFGLCVLWFALGVAGQILIPGRRMKEQGVRTSTLVLAVIAAVVGFFVIPGVGAPVGFVLGIFAVESTRTRDRSHAWQRTKVALRAVLTSMGIELIAAFAIVVTYVIGVLLHR